MVGEKIKERAKELGWSIPEVARRSSVPQRTEWWKNNLRRWAIDKGFKRW
jgi:transcriptional regulator with XRE-family HTH domain